MKWWMIAIPIMIMVDMIIVGAIIGQMRECWSRLTMLAPRVDPARDAVTRRFQSFSMGIINIGYGVHVTVDVDHLHLTPTKFMRWLGITSASIPWEQIEVLRPGARTTEVRINGQILKGPSWCFLTQPR